jgi:hypothetical protein
VRERVDLVVTPCNYGGTRPWFRCPQCWSRRRVLYSLGGHFRCRHCHDLAYSSTREDVHGRSIRRAEKLQKRLLATTLDPLNPPTRPQGMHRNTYERISAQLKDENRFWLRALRVKRAK